MKTAAFIFLSILTITLVSSCGKNADNGETPTDFPGKWTLIEIYGNDHWGGPAYWKNANGDTKIEFTADGKYFRKYPTDSNYTFIGTFQKLSDSTIRITQANPVNPSHPSYTLNYSFSHGGYMIWGIFGSEALIEEKYKIDR